MHINLDVYRSKVTGCWMGKNIGGTLGAPFEWKRQVNNVSFYTQDLGGEPLPNDDLDIQLLWLVALEEQGVGIDAHILSDYWLIYVTPHWAEYGTAKANMRVGLPPPLCGSLHNEYKHSCGAFIRSEIWACIAPGCPKVAARYALQDAILDHGDGEGTYAEVFCAALESAAFVEDHARRLIEIGLSYIPSDCGVAAAIQTAIKCYDSGMSWREARDEILAHHRGRPHGPGRGNISDEDFEKGFGTGKRGYDAPSNIGIIILGLLYGEGDFDKTMTTTVNCGEDTDCTGATVGSIYGIINGAEGIPDRWVRPIGRAIKTACLNLGELGYFGNQLPRDIDELTRRTERIARQLVERYRLPIRFTDEPVGKPSAANVYLRADDNGAFLYENLKGPAYRFPFFTITVDYQGDPLIRSGQAKDISFTIQNTYKVQADINIRWLASDSWDISPSRSGRVFSLSPGLGEPARATFRLKTPWLQDPVCRLAVEFTISGRPTVMLVPVILVNGDLQ